MRIPFPERVSYSHAFLFACVLAGLQLLQRSSPAMVGLVFCYILVAAAAFNFAGGFFRPSGAYVGANAVQTLLMPMVAKVLLGQPADRNLRAPVRTVEVYLCGTIAMLLAAVVAQRIRPAKAYISDMLSPSQLRQAYYGCIVFSLLVGLAQLATSGGGNGSVGSFLNQINFFPSLSFVLGVTVTVAATRGRSSLTWPLLFLMLYSSSAGLYTFSKQAFIAPFFCWAVACAASRYSLTWLNVITFAGALFLTVTYLVPYAQIGRDLNDGTRPVRELSGYMLTHMGEVRDQFKEQENASEIVVHDYDRPVTLLDRLDLLAVDDALVDLTDRTGYFGYQPLIAAIDNAVPHFLWPNKPPVYAGNAYGREIGILSTSDDATGISFSFASDAYHEGGIFCLLLICPFVFLANFAVLDWVIGDVRRNVVGLVTLTFVLHVATEGLLAGVLACIEQSMYAVVAVAFVAKYILPRIGQLFSRTPLAATPSSQNPLLSPAPPPDAPAPSTL